MPMAISRSDWKRLVELWDLSELVSIVSRALASLYMLKMGVYEPKINVRLLRDIEKCRSLLERVLKDLELYIDGKAPETMLVTLLIKAYGQVDVEDIKDRLFNAIQGLNKLDKMKKREIIDKSVLDDKSVLELEDVLRRLSDTLTSLSGKLTIVPIHGSEDINSYPY